MLSVSRNCSLAACCLEAEAEALLWWVVYTHGKTWSFTVLEEFLCRQDKERQPAVEYHVCLLHWPALVLEHEWGSMLAGV